MAHLELGLGLVEEQWQGEMEWVAEKVSVALPQPGVGQSETGRQTLEWKERVLGWMIRAHK